MEPNKLLGKTREQIRRENVARRKYSKKYDYLISDAAVNIYDPKHIENVLQNQNNKVEPFKIHPIYYKLFEECRCGRSKKNQHLLPCVQNNIKENNFNIDLNEKISSNKISNNNDSEAKFQFSENEIKMVFSNSIPIPNKLKNENLSGITTDRILPTKSNAIIGWPKHRFYNWEKTTFYDSPVYTMPGHKIAARPYNTIFVG